MICFRSALLVFEQKSIFLQKCIKLMMIACEQSFIQFSKELNDFFENIKLLKCIILLFYKIK